MYEYILYIIIYWCLFEIATYCYFFVSFFGFCFLKLGNVLRKKKTAKLVSLFKRMRARLFS